MGSDFFPSPKFSILSQSYSSEEESEDGTEANSDSGAAIGCLSPPTCIQAGAANAGDVIALDSAPGNQQTATTFCQATANAFGDAQDAMIQHKPRPQISDTDSDLSPKAGQKHNARSGDRSSSQPIKQQKRRKNEFASKRLQFSSGTARQAPNNRKDFASTFAEVQAAQMELDAKKIERELAVQEKASVLEERKLDIEKARLHLEQTNSQHSQQLATKIVRS